MKRGDDLDPARGIVLGAIFAAVLYGVVWGLWVVLKSRGLEG